MVPLATLLEERGKWEARLAALEAKNAAPPAAPTPPEPEPVVPDFLEDPKGYVDAQLARATKALEKLEKGAAADPRVQAIEQRQAETELSGALVASHDQFTSKTPDFPEALQFARIARARQLEVLNPGIDPKQIVQWVTQEERNLAAHLVRSGVNPAERVYELAKSMGYTPKQAAAMAATPPPANGAGARVVDPGLTLNSTPGTAHSEVDDSEPDILAQAQAERFVGSRRRN